METVEETPPFHNISTDDMKISVVSDVNDSVSAQSDVCHKSNGVADTADTDTLARDLDSELPETDSNPKFEEKMDDQTELNLELPADLPATESADPTVSDDTVSLSTQNIVTTDLKDAEPAVKTVETVSSNITKMSITESPDTLNLIDKDNENNEISKESTGTMEESIETPVRDISVQEVLVEATTVESESIEPSSDTVTFQTEVVVETNDNDLVENLSEPAKQPEQDKVGILNELGQNIELTEALRSSDVTDSVENNNCTVEHEVFNKEELIDILEGNNMDVPKGTTDVQMRKLDKMTETQIALQQLSRLKRSRMTHDKIVKKKQRDRRKAIKKHKPKAIATKITNESLINVLVKDWDDEDPVEECKKLLEESENLVKVASDIAQAEESVTNQDNNSEKTVDPSTSDEMTAAVQKAGEDSQPQRRLGRVIKKKVIFDPDNPDTFTKSKAVVKSKESEPEKEQPSPKNSKEEQAILLKSKEDQPIPKKIKVESGLQRSNSKSPTSKLQWKKPTSKPSCKQNKRLTEVDKLLMDEGAVNMIYQLTPEAPKGKKNMRTKAEFIKKIQSSTPDTKEMKFRERKKELKYEEGEAKKIVGGKRSSLSSSVKSPTVNEDFEAHSADDSIIYRRHSSSSYSSSCMSPRRLSDVESTPQSQTLNTLPATDGVSQNNDNTLESSEIATDVFMLDGNEVPESKVINKNVCLSIKEKLNSKLSLALNKRKRESAKDKPSKIKKTYKFEEAASTKIEDYKYLSINIDRKLAEISIQKTGSKCNVAVLKELEKALLFIETQKNISVTLLTAECAMLCSDLDLRPLLEDNVEMKTNSAVEILESVRSVLQAMYGHSKLVCSGVSGRCTGVGLALVALSDVVLASERACFAISQKSHSDAAPLMPGVAAVSTHCDLPQSLVSELLVFGRRLSAAEAVAGGLASRALWPERLAEQVRALAADLAAQPAQNILLKKQILNLKRSGSMHTFQSCLERERDLLVEYWTSAEGQELLRNQHNTS